jgi:hypothetical protein
MLLSTASFLGPRALAENARPGASTQKVLKAYRSSVEGLKSAKKQHSTLVKKLDDQIAAVKDSKYLSEIAGASSESEAKAGREAAARALLEADAEQTRANRQTKSDQRLISRARAKLGLGTRQIKLKPIEKERVDDISERSFSLLRADVRDLMILNRTLAELPQTVSGGLSFKAGIYGDEQVKNWTALEQKLDLVKGRLAKLDPAERVKRLEAALHARITAQIEHERPEFEKSLADKTNTDELVRSLGEIQEKLAEFSEPVAVQSQKVLKGGGHASSSFNASMEKKGWFADTKASASGGSSSSWHLEGSALLDGATQYVVKLKAPGAAGDGMLPIEARLILEKAAKASQIAAELKKREVPGAALWRNSSVRIELPPIEKYDSRGQTEYVDVPALTFQIQRPKRGLIALEKIGLVDHARAEMLKQEIAHDLTGDLE